MNFTESKAVIARFDQLFEEYKQALKMISSGCGVLMSDPLRQSLDRIAGEVQSAIDDGAVPALDDLTMLCAAETKSTFKNSTDKTQEDYACTLYYLSTNMLI